MSAHLPEQKKVGEETARLVSGGRHGPARRAGGGRTGWQASPTEEERGRWGSPAEEGRGGAWLTDGERMG